jgi:hypothetical protein
MRLLRVRFRDPKIFEEIVKLDKKTIKAMQDRMLMKLKKRFDEQCRGKS